MHGRKNIKIPPKLHLAGSLYNIEVTNVAALILPNLKSIDTTEKFWNEIYI